MNELDTLKRAKLYMDQLALGFDPVGGAELPDDTTLNQTRLARCFFYVSGVLAQVIENGGMVTPATVASAAEHPPVKKIRRADKQPFSATVAELATVKLLTTPVALSVFIKQINNAVVDEDTMRKLSYKTVSLGLIHMGFLTLVDSPTGNQHKIPTAEGKALGITREQRVNPAGQSYPVNLFDCDAQQFVLDNLDGILTAAGDV